MKIALTTIGSRGDIQPYIALGIALQKNGHDVTLLTHPWAKKIIRFYGLKHLPVGDDIDINYVARECVTHSSSNIEGFKFALNFIFDNLRACHQDFMSALKNFELIIGHAIVGQAEAFLLEKPFIMLSIDDMGLRKVYWQSNNIIKEVGVFLADKIKGALFGKPYMRYLKDVGVEGLLESCIHPYLAIIPMPSFLQKPHPNWKRTTEITGFIFAGTPDNYVPPKDLNTFIHQGDKPVLVTCGSMFHQPEHTTKLYHTICEGILKSNSRAILIMADLNPDETVVPEHVFLAHQIPYSWLLKQVSIVVHHFGFGTNAEVLKAGLPAIPIPHIFDQHIRAAKIHKLGYASKPLKINKLTSAKLAEAIIHVKNNQGLKNKCREAGVEIQNGNGMAKTMKLIDDYIERL